jgi:PqqD family protein of HPr-rel-A system
MPHSTPGQLLSWQLSPGQRLDYRQWDQEAVLFNDLSGDTHLLGADALALLLAIQGGAADLDALRAALAAAHAQHGDENAYENAHGDAQADAADAALYELLEQLASIALIEQRA